MLKEKDLEIIINKQFEINWYNVRFNDIKWDKWEVDWVQWFQYYTTTEDKQEEFKKWLINYLKKHCIKSRLEKETWRFLLQYWLNVKNKW